jgi:hypothetical protein
LALPREAGEFNKSNGLQNGLGKKRFIEFQGVLERTPKPKCAEAARPMRQPLGREIRRRADRERAAQALWHVGENAEGAL